MLLVVQMTNAKLESDFKIVLDCAYKVHTALGPGLLESAYEACLKYELTKAGLKLQQRVKAEGFNSANSAGHAKHVPAKGPDTSGVGCSS